ncbi:MAG: hypothetical protein ACFCU8_13245 [Thermosynechococcaceae cyanobacterium]
MAQRVESQIVLSDAVVAGSNELNLTLPDPEDDVISEFDFQQQVNAAWLVCDRINLQSDIWRGRILKAVRDREKHGGEGRGTGFLHWLQEQEISKSQAYQWIELANSADTLLKEGHLEPDAIDNFSKRAFVETAQATPEVQQLISETANQGKPITRREVQQLTDEWVGMTSDLVPAEIKAKAADQTIPTRYLAPFVRELEKLPEVHQAALQEALSEDPDIDTLKQVTNEAKQLAKYLTASNEVQAIEAQSVDLELSLEEALRLGCLNSAADMVNQAAQLEQTIAKLYTTWRRIQRLSEKVYADSGASTPNLRSLVQSLEGLCGDVLEIELGSQSAQPITVRLKMLDPDDG